MSLRPVCITNARIQSKLIIIITKTFQRAIATPRREAEGRRFSRGGVHPRLLPHDHPRSGAQTDFAQKTCIRTRAHPQEWISFHIHRQTEATIFEYQNKQCIGARR